MGISLRSLFKTKPKRGGRPRRRLLVEALEGRRLLASLPFGASDQDLGEFFLGSVAVTPVFLESNGALDASTENWNDTHKADVLANINEGLDWWVDTLATKTSIHELSFKLDPTFTTRPAETQYEPISRRSNDYTLYVAEFLASQGFSTGTLESNIRAFNHAQRVKLETDWSFTMFVVPSQNDADGNFASGGSFSRAFAFAGGLFMVVPSTRPASSFAHETGHMFWARDEYAGGGTYFSRRGYYNTQNVNAADNPAPGYTQAPSIMTSGTLLDQAYANHVSPASTLAMLGWQDSDGDGIFDVLDVPHRLTGAGAYNSSTGTYRFQGEALVQTLPNLNNSGLGNDITLNRIREIEYRFDNGPWIVHSHPDTYQATLDITVNVPSQAQQIEIRARDSKTTVVSNLFTGRIGRADATVTPGVNGHVWIDANKNGLRDVGELGTGGWSVELVGAGGAVLALRKTIEPDSLPDGVLSAGFSPHLTLTSIGTDADGKVGVFADSLTSTGSKVFWGFSRGSSSYQATWNGASRKLQATFSTPTSVVQIDAIGSSTKSYGRMEAYNSSGQLIGRYTTGQLSNGQVETMTIARGTNDIAFVNMSGHGSSVRLDNLQFGPKTTTVTNSFGGYSLPSLPPGQYDVRVTPNGAYRPLDPSSGLHSVSVASNLATTDVDFGFQNDVSPWRNPLEPLDVNNDTFISPVDVLLIVNEINARGSRDLRGSGVPHTPYIDVNGDSFVAAVDVLFVVNYLNSHI